MAGQLPERLVRRARNADVDSARPRALFSHGVAALAAAALGLAVAGSVAVTTSAQTPDDHNVGNPSTTVLAQPASVPTPTSASPRAKSPAARAAVIDELAAQRAEQLAKDAEAATLASRAAASDARQTRLTEAEETRNAAAAELAAENVRLTVAARLAAAQASAAAGQDPEALSATETDPNAIPVPVGGAGVSPVPGAVIGAHFGQYGIWSRYHTGLDFRAAYGTPIRAVKAGVVLYAGNSGDWAGNHVAIKHADGMTTMYSHMSSMATQAGQVVQAGQVIGYVGQTGRAFGAHLHFELYPVGVKYGDVYKAINPQPWLAANGVITH